jgi:hypothetical protein
MNVKSSHAMFPAREFALRSADARARTDELVSGSVPNSNKRNGAQVRPTHRFTTLARVRARAAYFVLPADFGAPEAAGSVNRGPTDGAGAAGAT